MRLLVYNSLDARYGSTYRMRALARLLTDLGHQVDYVEGAGPKALRVLGAALRAGKPGYDLLFTQKFNPVTLTAMALARLTQRPVLVDWDDLDPGLQGSRLKRALANVCERVGPWLATGITSHSQPILELAARGAPVTRVAQGVDLDAFRGAAATRGAMRRRLGATDDQLLVGHLCTFTSGGTIDLPTILEAYARVKAPNVKFVVVGGGPLLEHHQARCSALGLVDRVAFTGLVPHEDVPRWLAACDLGVVFMSDSPSNEARVSLKVLEYLAAGIPALGRLVGESRRLFGDAINRAESATELALAIDRAARCRPTLAKGVAEAFCWSRSGEALASAVGAAYAAGPRGRNR